jgi:hypothetical protein
VLSILSLLTGVLLVCPALGQLPCIQNPNFNTSDGWNLTRGGLSGVAEVRGVLTSDPWLELSVSFPSDFAEARQTCVSTAPRRTLTLEVRNPANEPPQLDVTDFLMGWGTGDGTLGDSVLADSWGFHSVTTTNPAWNTVILFADGTQIGPSAQAVDNVQVNGVPIAEFTSGMADFLVTGEGEPEDADFNGDGDMDVADIVAAVNAAPNPP